MAKFQARVEDRSWRLLAVAVASLALVAWASSAFAGWTITARNSVDLSDGPLSNIRELSGVTYIGQQAGGLERFAAIQDENRRIVIFEVSFAANGSISSATAVSDRIITGGSDFEGIAYTGPARNTVFVSEENTPTIREFSLSGGPQMQEIVLPDVFWNNRDNRGLESLTRSLDGSTMWTANEEALTVDGPASSQTAGTVVRLQQMTDDGGNVSFGPQYAYLTDPIHAGPSPNRNGVPDLVMLPDDTLLVMERSRNGGPQRHVIKIYEANYSDATDVSQPPLDDGLIGRTYTTVDKRLLWTSQFGGGFDPEFNVEGIGLGPRLANGNWVLLGVADNAGSGGNPIVSWELSLTGCAIAGDFNCNGSVDDADYTLWKNLYGSTGMNLAADGNGDGIVDAADYTIWRNAGALPAEAAAAHVGSAVVPEPAAIVSVSVAVALVAALIRKRRGWRGRG